MFPEGKGHEYMQQQEPNGHDQAHGNQIQVWYPAKTKESSNSTIDGHELYEGLGSEFLEWGRRFERHIDLAQPSCGFKWPEDGKVYLLGFYISEAE